jgi:hypothetical protein
VSMATKKKKARTEATQQEAGSALRSPARRIAHAEWLAEATAKFGDDPLKWRFVCPSCGHQASVKDWKDAGATEGEVAFSCVGRRLPNAVDIFVRPGPCNYAGGGLFGLNPVTVVMEDGKERSTFEFAEMVS